MGLFDQIISSALGGMLGQALGGFGFAWIFWLIVIFVVQFFRDRGTDDVQELEVIREDVRFMLPKTIRQALAGTS